MNARTYDILSRVIFIWVLALIMDIMFYNFACFKRNARMCVARSRFALYNFNYEIFSALVSASTTILYCLNSYFKRKHDILKQLQ